MELNDPLGLTAVAGTEHGDRIGDVIFVHGLGGGSQTTWAAGADPTKFLPAWFAREFPRLGFWTLGYGTAISSWKERTMPLADLGNQVLEELHVEGIGIRPIIFITHSMGGLVTKQLLSHAKSQGVARWEKIAENTEGIAFLATPHSGANLANFAEFASIVLNTSEQVAELRQHSARLRELHGAFLSFVNRHRIVCRTFAERREVKPGVRVFKWNIRVPKGILVVDETSAEPNIPGERAIPLDEDHLSICKPSYEGARICKYLRSFLKECIGRITFPH